MQCWRCATRQPPPGVGGQPWSAARLHPGVLRLPFTSCAREQISSFELQPVSGRCSAQLWGVNCKGDQRASQPRAAGTSAAGQEAAALAPARPLAAGFRFARSRFSSGRSLRFAPALGRTLWKRPLGPGTAGQKGSRGGDAGGQCTCLGGEARQSLQRGGAAAAGSGIQARGAAGQAALQALSGAFPTVTLRRGCSWGAPPAPPLGSAGSMGLLAAAAKVLTNPRVQAQRGGRRWLGWAAVRALPCAAACRLSKTPGRCWCFLSLCSIFQRGLFFI